MASLRKIRVIAERAKRKAKKKAKEKVLKHKEDADKRARSHFRKSIREQLGFDKLSFKKKIFKKNFDIYDDSGSLFSHNPHNLCKEIYLK